MEFTNFDQMNQMIVAASGLLTQTLFWMLCGLALVLSLCSVGGALLLGLRDMQQGQTKHALSPVAVPASGAAWTRLIATDNAIGA